VNTDTQTDATNMQTDDIDAEVIVVNAAGKHEITTEVIACDGVFSRLVTTSASNINGNSLNYACGLALGTDLEAVTRHKSFTKLAALSRDVAATAGVLALTGNTGVDGVQSTAHNPFRGV